MFSTYSKQVVAIGLLLLSANACKQDNDVVPSDKEAAYARLLVTDADGATVSLVSPAERTSQEFQSRFSGSNVYATRSGRFAALVNYASDYVQFSIQISNLTTITFMFWASQNGHRWWPRDLSPRTYTSGIQAVTGWLFLTTGMPV